MSALDFLRAMSYTQNGSASELLKTPVVNIDGECRGLVVVTPSVIPISVSEVSTSLSVDSAGKTVTVSDPEKVVSVKIIKKEVIHE